MKILRNYNSCNMTNKNIQKDKTVKTVFRMLLIVVISLVFGLSIYSWNAKSLRGDLLPMPFGIGMGVVLTGSMEPNISENDLIIVKTFDEYKIDEVIVYQSQGNLIVHRIIEIDGNLVITKGDANNVPDEPIEVNQIKGKVVKVFGGVGTIIKFLKSPIGVVMILGISVTLLVLSYKKDNEDANSKINSIKEEIRKLKKEIENK